jgi:ABC-type branched-subunit amino acid transport system permease subunit
MTLRARGLAVLALLALYALPWALDVVRLRMAIEILYFGLFAVSFNLLFGFAGLPSGAYGPKSASNTIGP